MSGIDIRVARCARVGHVPSDDGAVCTHCGDALSSLSTLADLLDEAVIVVRSAGAVDLQHRIEDALERAEGVRG